MNKKNMTIVALATFCLTATLFMTLPIKGETPVGTYDPWLDLNDDGRINILDVITIANHYSTNGTPIDKIVLLIEVNNTFTSLLSRIDYLNASLAKLQTDVDGSNMTNLMPLIDVLNASLFELRVIVIYMNSTLSLRIDTLDMQFAIMNTVIMQLGSSIVDLNNRLRDLEGRVEYDSGWIDITSFCGKYYRITHNLNCTEVVLEMIGRMTFDGGVHQINFGGTIYQPGRNSFYNYQGASNDTGYCIVGTDDGGYAVVDFAYIYNGGCALVKMDADGDVMWRQTFAPGTGLDLPRSLVQTNDGGYAFVGYTNSIGVGGFDVWLVKTDARGNLQWQRTFGGTGNDYGYSLVQTSDGGYAITGFTYSFGASGDVYLIKTCPTGNLMWSRTYGGPNSDYGYSVVQTSDGGYAVAGMTYSYGAGNGDAYLVKTDSTGNMNWSRAYGDWGSREEALSIIQTSDGGYALAGSRLYGYYDAYLVKVDFLGNRQWNKTYGGPWNDWGRCVIRTSDGGYMIAGETNSSSNYDAYLVKTDSTGNIQWNRTYGGKGNDGAFSVVQTIDGGYVFAGFTNSYGVGSYDVYVCKTEVESGLIWVGSTADTITLYRGATDMNWNFVRVRIRKITAS